MGNISSWSSSAGGNTSASPNGFPEGMAPSGVNDAAREVMASVRRWYEDAEWLDFSNVPTYAATNTFTLAGDKTSVYHAKRRLRAKDGANTLYGEIASSSYTTNTRVSVTLDSGAFTTSLSAVAVGILSFTPSSIPDDISAGYAKSAGYAATADLFFNPEGWTATSSHTLTPPASYTLLTLDLTGTATVGDRIWVQGNINVSAHSAAYGVTIYCSAFNSNHLNAGNANTTINGGHTNIAVGENIGIPLSGIFRVVSATSQLRLKLVVSTASGTAAVATGELYATCFKRQR